VNTLFPVEPQLPEGFEYIPDFLTEQEEAELIKNISTISLHAFIFQGFEAKRKMASFGYDYSFDKRKLSKGKDIPGFFDPLINNVCKQLSINPENFGELLVLEYPVGAVINWHRDAPPFDVIVGISLMADCTFRLRPHDKAKQGRASIISFPVKRRSLYVMQGIVRSEWQHSTAPVKEIRYSITLRTLR
jgi:alkylated DNA repair dioxygenase AlkB